MNKFESTILILGHSGFIGSNLESSLQNKGLKVIGKSLPEVNLGDSLDILKIRRFFTPQTTIILAAAVKRQFGDTQEAYSMNMAIVENVCRLLVERPVKRVIFFSSAAVYGEETHNTSINEETQVNPTSYYGISKYTSERLLERALKTNNYTSLVCLRPPLAYGPGDMGKTYGPAGFASAAKEGSSITLWGDGKELREFLFIEDLCKIVEYLIHSEFSGVLNAVSGTSNSFADVIDLLRSAFPNLSVTSRERSKQKADNAFDGSKLRSLLGSDFEFTSLVDGLQATIAKN
jgi:UDP-glucose 4-epimerase